MRDFEFHAPGTLAEAQALLSRYGDDARLLAGGTGLVNMMKQNLVRADHLVSLHRVRGLRYIRWTPEGLRVGALTTQREMETSALVRRRFPLLAAAYKEVASVRIRNVATVGGGVAHGDPAQDPSPALLVLDARVVLASARRQRQVPVRRFLRDYYETDVRPGEVVTEVIVPPPPPRARSVYVKFLPRTADDYATVSAAALAKTREGIVQDVRLALGAVGSTAILSRRVSRILTGKVPTRALVQQAADAVAAEVHPNSDFRGSDEYKTEMAVVFARRALEQVLRMRT